MASRGPADTLLALALVHHLAIGNNVPLPEIAAFFAEIGTRAIVEFVPKSDSQIGRMLVSREDVFPDYSQAGFEAAFTGPFEILCREGIAGTERTLYLLARRGAV